MNKTPRLSNLKPRIATLDTRTAKPLPKGTDEHYGTADHKAWALDVKQRAGWRCERVENGHRCGNRHPTSVMYADHKIEVKDDPSLRLDPRNGECLCASHHSKKTVMQRTKRMSN